MERGWPVLAMLGSLASAGCYHFTFEQEPARTRLTSSGTALSPGGETPKPVRTVTYEETVPTYLNGFVGTGRVAAYEYCQRPVRTELRVTTNDVLLSMMTLLIYTPHTLYVTCERT